MKFDIYSESNKYFNNYKDLLQIFFLIKKIDIIEFS